MNNKIRAVLTLSFTTVLLLACDVTERATPLVLHANAENTSSWPDYGGKDAQHYVVGTDITPHNVDQLKKVWEYHTGDMSAGEPGMPATSAFENTPILVAGTLYLCSPFNRVVALNPATGEERWTFDPDVARDWDLGNQFVCRGVSHWKDPNAPKDAACASRIFMATVDARLVSLDAQTGKRCADFNNGEDIDLSHGVGEAQRQGEYSHTSPPAIIDDIVIVGGSVSDNARMDGPSGVVRGFDARSGEKRWAWDLAPPNFVSTPQQLTSEGYTKGTPNVWAPISVDAKRDLVFVPTGNPSPDYFRPGDIPLDYYGSAVVALRGSTGEPVWRYQMVHNDHWDFDTPAQPALVDLVRNGVTIPALVQATKMGFLFVLHRETGEPLFPVEERPVPQSEYAGDTLSPTQPFPVLPPPLVPTNLSPEDAWGITPWDRSACRKTLESLNFEGMYTPATEQWTLMYPGNAGGSNWGGIAVDPQRQVAVANLMDVPWIVRLIKREEFAEMRAKNPGEISAQAGTPYGMWRKMLLSPLGLPCNPPPWGKLVAVDLNSGEILWDVPLGTVRDVAPIPLPWKLGVPNIGGPLVTEGGLIFIGAAMDNYIRAFDTATGEELWKARLPAGGQATPMGYSITDLDGRQRQFVVIAAGGHGRAGTTLGDSVIAYALPQ